MSGRIPPEFIDELLARTDIVDVIDSRVPLKKTGRDYQARCPFHDERTPSFTVSQTKQFYHCFGCGAHGSAIGFLMDYEHMEFREAVEHLATRAGLVVPSSREDRTAPLEHAVDLEAALACAQRHFEQQLRQHPQAESAVAYLKGRGLTGEVALRFGLGYAPEGWDILVTACGSGGARAKALVQAGLAVRKETGRLYDRFRNRITFPIHDHRGKLVGFGGRAIGNDEPKYLNTPETPLFHKGAELYHLFAARGAIRSAGRALVVEGYMDVVALDQFGVDNAVATLGTATTKTHLERLFRHCPEIVFCFDGDRAGRAAAWRALEVGIAALRDGRQISFLFLPEGQDPDTLVRGEGTEAFRRRMAGSIPLPEFLLQNLTEQVDLSRMDGRARLASLAKPLIAKLEAGVLREMLVERLARLCELPRDALEKQLRSTTAAPERRGPAHDPSPSGRGTDRGALRTALALALQQPQLARIVGDLADLHALHRVGAEALAELVEVVRHHPGLSTGALVERFRDRDYLPELEKLAAWDHLIPEEQIELEFRSAIRRLHLAAREHEAQELLSESRRRELNAGEKDRLRNLLNREDAPKGT